MLTARSINTDNSYVLREQVIAALNNSSTILLPFTIDPHGGIGPLASRFLFGTTPDPAPAPAPAPLTFQHWIPQQAYNNTISASLPSAILLHADKSCLASELRTFTIWSNISYLVSQHLGTTNFWFKHQHCLFETFI
jgi:hypothetical protein